MKIEQVLNYIDKRNFEEFYINSCGITSQIDENTSTARIQGRKDYHIIGVADGKFYVQKDGKEICYNKNTILFFKPDMPQIYHCNRNEGTKYFWLHFDGTVVKEIMTGCGIFDEFSYTRIINDATLNIVKEIILQTQNKKSGYEVKNLSLFCELLLSFTKDYEVNAESDNNRISVLPAYLSIKEDPKSKYSISDYASMCSMSKYHFIHKFKEEIGISPLKYKNNILMDKAAFLLDNTDLSIYEIANKLGFEDPLYFSKKFKLYCGLSPTQFRKKYRA